MYYCTVYVPYPSNRTVRLVLLVSNYRELQIAKSLRIGTRAPVVLLVLYEYTLYLVRFCSSKSCTGADAPLSRNWYCTSMSTRSGRLFWPTGSHFLKFE